MSQIALPLDIQRPAAPRQPTAHPAVGRARAEHDAPGFDETGHRIGLDHARHGLTPPPDHLHPGHPVREGWMRGRSAFAGRTRPAPRAVQQWLALRLQAWLRGQPFDDFTVTPRLLARIDVPRCPVTRESLTHGEGAPADAVTVAVCEASGFTAGNLVVMSRRAAAARQWTPAHGPDPLDSAQRQRLTTLLSLGTALPHDQARAVPLTLLPPVRLRLRNPVQAVQVLLAQVFAGHPSRRVDPANLAVLMPEPARRACALYMSALLARSLDIPADADAEQRAQAMEDAGAHPSVHARWRDLARGLTEEDALRIVRTAVHRGLWPRPCRWVEDGGWEGPEDLQGQRADLGPGEVPGAASGASPQRLTG